jgi:protein-disulfide isomerase
MKRALPFVIIVVVLIAALAVFYRGRSSETHRPGSTGNSQPVNRALAVKPGADPPHLLGAVEAPVMIEEFGDLECASCGQLHPIIKTMKAEFGKNLVIVFREFPLVSRHPHALEAARAAEAAGLQGKFWEMHDMLYENQKTWHDAAEAGPIFEAYAVQIGLALDQFKRDINSPAVDQRLELDRERGVSIGVDSTPTVFLNGREVTLEALSIEKLRALINAELKSAASK